MVARVTLLLSAYMLVLSDAAETTLVITPSVQTGFFKIGHDIGALNPHDYRPNEFVSNDFVFEGLTAWDGEHPKGADGVAGNEDDYVAPSLAVSWVTNLAAVKIDPATPYEIVFTLRPGVQFHDGTTWNAFAAKANFDQIMGGYGLPGGSKAMKGMHDWLGFTQSLDSWDAVSTMSFKLTFTTFYEAALRELSFIRPFRMISPSALPSMADMELSHVAFRGGEPRVFGGYTMRGVKAPIGTGPYMVIDKLLSTESGSSRRLPAAEFNATCYQDDVCTYNTNEYVAEVLFKKFTNHRKKPIYDNVIMRAYSTVEDIKTALLDGSLDVAYGVQTLSPSAFLSLATAGEGSSVVAHRAPTDLNTRHVTLNSGGQLNTPDLRKLVMGILAPGRQVLYDGELAEEQPMETLFDPALPHCGVLSTLSSIETLAASKDPSVTAASITQPLRFIYNKDVPHQQMIAAKVVSDLFLAGIQVDVMPVDKDTYNARMCDYLGPNEDGVNGTHSWDIAYSETWGPPYDPTSKLWDMTHGLASGWCSQEADAPAVSNMASMPLSTFVNKVRTLSSIVDQTEREAAYTEVLTVLHDEAIFLPLTAKRQIAVTNKRVSGFQFGYMEYDLPLAPLYPTPGTIEAAWTYLARAAGWLPCKNGDKRRLVRATGKFGWAAAGDDDDK